MKTLSKLLPMLAACFVLAIPAKAQNYSIQTTTLTGGTNNVSATTTNSSLAIVMPVPKSSFIGIQPSFKLTGSGTTAVVFSFDESIDNSVWTSGTQTLSITPAGTTVVTGIKNFSANGVGFLRLSSIANANATAITNLVVKFATKNGL